MDAPGGRLLHGRYQVERKLGEGGTAVVWLVRDTRERGQVWALKELDFSGIISVHERDDAVRHFEREADILMRLSHPALPEVVDRFSEGGRQYLVLERVEGPTLDQVLQRRGGPIDEREAVRWARQLCEVLAYLHGCVPPVVYRDLKPANVMLSVDGRVRLIDFGIARPLHPQRAGDTAAYGTPGYAPPEQHAGHAVPASDVHALGVTLFQLLTGCDPQSDAFRLVPARTLNPVLSTEAEALMIDCTRPNPAERPSLAEVQARLTAIGGGPAASGRWLQRAARWLGLR